ncbi:ribosomal protein S18-alanine N-acetyltransferase [Sneathiella sp. P13V-1]|uniref:ribosomal protein S18-alanine N-acetyltransferase n=1 Tax=Sneathiella sp. P13V-1 TaxID=2697366 RepID=UPI00187B8797|nr:ribosomal protein S18-alanine N-acetyltransferase [Sneathiella sp. P13V-1]MBE7635849.1 ribosomal protein S18-alanine N-acetyltransferase [Sneathiella sp. P13V-1]
MTDPEIAFFEDATAASVMAVLHKQCFDKNWSEEEFGKLLALPGVFCHILSLNGQPCGFSLCNNSGEEAEILTICILPDCRGRALGDCLLSTDIEHLRASNCPRLFLEVAENNVSARRLYEKSGFKKIGIRRNYYLVGEQKIDALVLEKNLNEI